MIELRHGDARALIDPSVGNIPAWQVTGRCPLHAAPWRDEPEVQDNPDLPAVNKRLAGDFLCMPFGADDAGGPPHGPTANGAWEPLAISHAHADLRLAAGVQGAHVDKRIRLTGPVLYQTHVIEGGAGTLTVAHHPMSRMAEGGRLSFSPKRAALTDPEPQCAGRNLWALNQIRPDLRLACDDGSQWDLHDYPAGHAVEDFATLVEARGARIGWTVLIREAEDDMLVVLKDAEVLPVTMLWVSNGGREFPPWNGRHRGVLGIEDGRACGSMGLAAARTGNRLTAMGVPTTLALGGRHVIRHAMASLPRPPGWGRVTAVTEQGGRLTLTEAGGDSLAVGFDEGFFAP